MKQTLADAHTDEVTPFISLLCSEAEFLDVIGTKVSKSFPPGLFTITPTNKFDSPPPPEQKWFETGL